MEELLRPVQSQDNEVEPKKWNNDLIRIVNKRMNQHKTTLFAVLRPNEKNTRIFQSK